MTLVKRCGSSKNEMERKTELHFSSDIVKYSYRVPVVDEFSYRCHVVCFVPAADTKRMAACSGQ